MESEVEVKVQVTEDEFARVIGLVASVAQQQALEEHRDVYFSRPGSFLDEPYPFEWLSVRERNGAALLSYKHFFPEGAEQHTHCNEIEVGVASAGAAIELLRGLGFREAVIVEKTRSVYPYRETLVCLDRVSDLGFFVEVEARERVNLDTATRAVKEVLETLGLSDATRDLRGYPFRLLERRGGQ